MKVKMINLVPDSYWNDREHLELGTLAAVLSSNYHETKLISFSYSQANRSFVDTANNIVENAQALFFSFDFVYEECTIELVFRLVRQIKCLNSKIIVIMIGQRAGMNYEDILRDCPDIDYIIIGDAEIAALELLKVVNTQQNKNDCLGIAYKKGDSVIKTEPSKYCFSTLPWSIRDPDFLITSRIAKIRTSRGCTAKCSFCLESENLGYSKRWRGRDIKNDVINEIKQIINNYDIKQFNFLDSSMEDPGRLGLKRLDEFVNSIKEERLNIYYSCLFRAETFSTAESENIVRGLSNSGLSSVLVGIESGNEDDLHLFNKRANINDNLNACALFNKYNVNVIPGFIMFHPYSSIASLESNLNFLNNIKKSYSFLSYCRVLRLFPGVKLVDKLKEDNLIVGNLDYKAPLKYEFLNNNIKLLASSLNNVRENSEAIKLAITIDYAMNLLSKIYKNYVEWNGVNQFSENLKTVSNEFGDCVRTFFYRCLEITSESWNQELIIYLIKDLEDKAKKFNVGNIIKNFIKLNKSNKELKYVI